MNTTTQNLEVKPDTNSLTTPVVAREGDDPAAAYSNDDIVADDSATQNYGNPTPSSPSTSMDQDVDQLISQLSRPVYVGTINPASSVVMAWQPWHTWTMNNFIASKLAYFRYVRFDITVRISVSTSPYNCGRGLVYYVPCASGLPSVGADLPISSAVTVQYSALLDLSESKTYDLTIPFHGIGDYIDRTNIVSAGVDTSTPMNGLPAGYINYKLLGSLRNINAGSPTGATIVIYVLANNIKLVFPMYPEMKAHKTEVSTKPSGKISGPATTVAKIANAASNIPFLSGVAKATEMAANGVATVASLFGYSNPVVLPREGVVLAPQSFSNFNVEQPGHKLSLDANQELALGHHVFDSDADTLGVGFLTRKWGIYEYSNIDTSLSTVGYKIKGNSLSPSNLIPNPTADTAFEMTPLAYAALFFKYWRGSIELFIDFNITKYHRGKIGVFWSPGGLTVSLVDHVSTTPLVIHDLANGPSIHVEFPYVSDVAWGQTGDFQVSTANPWDFQKMKYPIGNFTIAMIEPVICPGVTKTIDYQIYVRGGKDFEFAVPSRRASELIPQRFNINYLTTKYEFSSTNYPVGTDQLDEGDFDVDWHNGIESYDFQIQLPEDRMKTILPVPQPLDSVGMETMGERIVSFRPLFKRFYPLVCPDLTWNLYMTLALPARPLGPNIDGPSGTMKNCKFEIVPSVLYGYLFDYWRGTMRYLFIGNDSRAARVSADDILAPGLATSATLTGGSAYMKKNSRFAGFTPIGPDANSLVPVDVPFQSRFAWAINTPERMYRLNPTGQMGTMRGVIFKNFRNNSVPPEIHTAIGEDFTYRDFKWIPIMDDITAVIG